MLSINLSAKRDKMSTPLQNWITDSLNDPELARVMTFDAAKALWRQDLTAPLPASKRTRQGVGSAYLALRLRLRQSAPEIDRIVGRQAHQLQAMLFCLKRPDVARRVAERRHLIEMLDAAGHMVSPEVFMVAPDEVCLIVTNMLFGYREDIPSSAYPVVDRKRAEELAVLAEKACFRCSVSCRRHSSKSSAAKRLSIRRSPGLF